MSELKEKVKMVEISFSVDEDGGGISITVRDDDLDAYKLSKIALNLYRKTQKVRKNENKEVV